MFLVGLRFHTDLSVFQSLGWVCLDPPSGMVNQMPCYGLLFAR